MLDSARSRAVVGALLLATAACTSARAPVLIGSVDKGAGTVTAARKFLEGRWTLESFEVRSPGKPPMVLNGTGTLNYDDFGNLRMEVRADQAASDLLRASGIDIRDGIISTDGRTTIDLQNRTLTYILAGQPASTGPLALSRPRHWEVAGDLLTLTTQDDSGAPVSVSRWKKSQ